MQFLVILLSLNKQPPKPEPTWLMRAMLERGEAVPGVFLISGWVENQTILKLVE